MQVEKTTRIVKESITLKSVSLDRTVSVDFYQPFVPSGEMNLLLINDGQELERLGLTDILEDLYGQGLLKAPLLCAGIHAGGERKMEYGTAMTPDYLGRGGRAAAYTRFVLEELLPVIGHRFPGVVFTKKAFAGFSLGALSAMDIGWNHPEEFSTLGLFSGSFWWRTKDKEDPGYNEQVDRIMQRQVKEGRYHPGQRFFFECGTEDETEDRNHNGVIDSIDDTRDLINELVAKGFDPAKDIHYWEIEGGRHEVDTWARAMPEFLRWAWG